MPRTQTHILTSISVLALYAPTEPEANLQKTDFLQPFRSPLQSSRCVQMPGTGTEFGHAPAVLFASMIHRQKQWGVGRKAIRLQKNRWAIYIYIERERVQSRHRSEKKLRREEIWKERESERERQRQRQRANEGEGEGEGGRERGRGKGRHRSACCKSQNSHHVHLHVGRSEGRNHPNPSRPILDTLLDLCVSSLRRGHANLLCIVPILSDDPRIPCFGFLRISPFCCKLKRKAVW